MKRQRLLCAMSIVWLSDMTTNFSTSFSTSCFINESQFLRKRVPYLKTFLSAFNKAPQRDLSTRNLFKCKRFSSFPLLALTNEEVDDENYSEKLSAAVGNLFQISQGTYGSTADTSDDDEQTRPSPKGIHENPDDVSSFGSQFRNASPQWNELLGTLTLEDIDTFDYSSFPYEVAPLLDPETYSSITGTTVFPKNYGPESSYDYDDGNDGDDNQEYYNYRANMDPEELHQLIMKQEPGYYSQSDVFKEALLYTQTLNSSYYSQKAAKSRRSTEWTARQQRAIQDLEREMDSFQRDLENTLKQKELRKLEEIQRQNKTVANKQMDASSRTSDEGKIPLASRQQQEGQQQQLSDGTKSRILDSAAESLQYERQQQRSEFFRTEMNKYKVRAQTAENEVRRLRAVIQSLEEAIASSSSSGGTTQSAEILEKEKLPPGWELVEETVEHGGNYYFNIETGAISWEFPSDN
jgi:hypothetical protein